jgi:hypothetical protein
MYAAERVLGVGSLCTPYFHLGSWMRAEPVPPDRDF